MPLSPGDKLGPYEILAPLGAGGMGEVYRARDARLARDVALKILPPEMAGDPSRRHRFRQEAQAVAALNHPNIVTIYDVGDGYIVTELVDGEPLRSAKPGLRKTIDLAIQIAEGLAAAHEARIVHRDLKPENILLTREGRAKILDFGLARVTRADAAASGETVTVHTQPGTVMGTVGYMSPEQVRGAQVDYRSDIFSFGAILYELLAGERAFSGDTSAEIMTAILKQEPADLPPSLPAAVRRIVEHCLEKAPADRFQSAKDLAFALSSALTTSGASPVLPPRSLRRWMPVAAWLAIACGLALAALWLRPKPAPRWSGVTLGGPEVALSPRVSPDGHLLAFVAVVGEVMQVGVMNLESGDYAILSKATGKGYAGITCWSRDGSRIYYDRWTDVPRGIYSVPVLGGEEQLLLEDAGSPEALPDGSLMVGRFNAEHQYQVFRFWPESGRLQAFPIESSLNGYSVVRAFPEVSEVLAVGTVFGPGRENGAQIYRLDLESGKARLLLPAPRPENPFSRIATSRDGKSILATWVEGNAQEVVSISRDGRSVSRLPLMLTGTVENIDSGPGGAVFVDQQDRPAELLRFSPQGGRAERIAALPSYEAPGGPFLNDEIFAVLPDGRVVLTLGTGGRRHLVVAEAGKEPVRLLNTNELSTAPVTAAGPGQIAFLIGPDPDRTIAIASVSNRRVLRRIPFDKGPVSALASTPDGKTLFCAAGGKIWSIPESGEPRAVRDGDHVAVDPEGHYLVVQVTEASIIHLFRMPLNGGVEREIQLTGEERPAFEMGPDAVGKDGRILMPMGTSTWYWPAGVIEPSSGRFGRIPVERILDYHALGWTADGMVVATGLGLSSKLWKFFPDAN